MEQLIEIRQEARPRPRTRVSSMLFQDQEDTIRRLAVAFEEHNYSRAMREVVEAGLKVIRENREHPYHRVVSNDSA